MLGLLPSGPPAWFPPGCHFAMDFCRNRYWGSYVDQKFTEDTRSLLSNSGAYGATPYTPTRSGQLLAGLTLQNRITDLGLFVERASTNECLWCRDLTNAAWAASSATVAKNQVGNVIGTSGNNASSITATANGATVLQAITLSSKAVVFSAYVKRLTGSGTVKITSDGTTWTDVTSQLNASFYAWVQNAVQTLSSVSCGFQLGTSGDAIAVDFCQLELAPLAGNKATTPLFTTSVTASRTNEVAYATNTSSAGPSGNDGQRIMTDIFSYGGPHSCMVTFNGDCTSTSFPGPVIIASDWTSPTSITGGGAGVFGGATNNTANSGTNGRGNWNKAIFRTTGAGRTFCLNGGAVSANNTGAANLPNGNSGGTHCNFGNNGGGTQDSPLNGSIGHIFLWRRELSDGQMMEYTNINSLYGNPYM